MAPAVLELVTAAVLALLCGRFAGQPSVLAFGLLLALLRPGQLGGGDIKLAGLIGLGLGWPTVIAGAVLAFVLTAVVSLALLAARRIGLHDAICFGPFMLGGALLAILASGIAGS
jgi:prepilin signal peptidase PulO-like enzyme (type II secretory pathway)